MRSQWLRLALKKAALYHFRRRHLESSIVIPHASAGFIVERIGQNLRDESLFRRLTGGNVRWASRRWKTRSFSKPW